jgi:hypothetical protein
MSNRESHFKSPGTTKTGKAGDAIDVAARYFVYKLYEATEGQPGQWRALYGMGESAGTISRAVERGWVTLDVNRKPLERRAALTDEGRRLARRGRPESKPVEALPRDHTNTPPPIPGAEPQVAPPSCFD